MKIKLFAVSFLSASLALPVYAGNETYLLPSKAVFCNSVEDLKAASQSVEKGSLKEFSGVIGRGCHTTNKEIEVCLTRIIPDQYFESMNNNRIIVIEYSGDTFYTLTGYFFD